MPSWAFRRCVHSGPRLPPDTVRYHPIAGLASAMPAFRVRTVRMTSCRHRHRYSHRGPAVAKEAARLAAQEAAKAETVRAACKRGAACQREMIQRGCSPWSLCSFCCFPVCAALLCLRAAASLAQAQGCPDVQGRRHGTSAFTRAPPWPQIPPLFVACVVNR